MARILSGMRPTGRLHLGNLVGALQNWVRLQNEHECYFEVADWHALTTGYEDTSSLAENVRQVVLDYLAAGLDPERCTIFVQSQVLEHAELHLLFSMVTPVGWLERVPTYKQQMQELQDKDLSTYGFLGYPVLQAADILIYRAEAVPVGEDQVPHIELTREIARRFNHFFGAVFPEPQSLLNVVAVLPGIDGRKMSKSYGNQINISDPPPVIREKVGQMITDKSRIYRKDPGHPDICAVHTFYRIFAPDIQEERAEACRRATRGCVECKKLLAEALVQWLGPLQERRRRYEQNDALLKEILEEGRRRAQVAAADTMRRVRAAIGMFTL
ncbi:MAG TPA: tryptophan--tRNA ligase [Firmicutes bacterium]|nr:tryptophan--tRNA ligase [Bacillota bacterium]